MGGRGGAPNATTNKPSAKPAAAPVAPGDQLQADILHTYHQLERQYDNEWVILTELRSRIGGSRDQQDTALRQLAKDRKIRLIPEENQQTLRPADREAGIDLGGEMKHLIGIPR